MAFTLSDSCNDGDRLPNEFMLSADFGFGCAGGQLPASLMGFFKR